MIICGLLAAELAEDWFQGLSKGWWLYVGYWLQNMLRIGSKVDDYMWEALLEIGWGKSNIVQNIHRLASVPPAELHASTDFDRSQVFYVGSTV